MLPARDRPSSVRQLPVAQRPRSVAPALNRSLAEIRLRRDDDLPSLPCGRTMRPTVTIESRCPSPFRSFRGSRSLPATSAATRRGNRRRPAGRRARRRPPPACAQPRRVRPCRPITRPSSPGAIVSSTTVCPRRSNSVTRPRRAGAASARATTSTTSRARLTTRPVLRPRGAGGIRSISVRTVSDGCRAGLQPVRQPLAIDHQRLRLRARVVVPEHLDEPAVARRPALGHDHAEERPVLRTRPPQTNH